MAAKKVTFTLPSDLVRRIKKLRAGKRSRFVRQAIEKELDRQYAPTRAKVIGAGEDAIAALERLRKRRTWDKNFSLEIKKHRRLIKQYSGKAKGGDFGHS